jgi:hypothetical protein
MQTYDPNQILIEAQDAISRLNLQAKISLDICRHPNAHNPSLWLFAFGTDKQIGSVSRQDTSPSELLKPEFKGAWLSHAISHGMPVTRRICHTLDEAIKFASE